MRSCDSVIFFVFFFFFQAEDGIRDLTVTGVQTCALPISPGDYGDVHAARAVRAGPHGHAHRSAGWCCGGGVGRRLARARHSPEPPARPRENERRRVAPRAGGHPPPPPRGPALTPGAPPEAPPTHFSPGRH